MTRGETGPDTRRLDTSEPGNGTAAPEPETRALDAAKGIAPATAAGTQAPQPRQARSRAARLVAAGLALLALAVLGAAIETLAGLVLAPAGPSAWAAAAGTLLLGLAAVLAAVREGRAFARLRKLETLRARAEAALAGEVADDPALVPELRRIYRARPDVAPALRRFRAEAEGVGDAANQLAAFDAIVLADLDERVERAAVGAVRRSATATAVSPFAVLDAAVTAWVNLRLIREIAAIYGGRPGTAATLRLLRRAFVGILAAGVFERAQDAVSDILGESVAGRVSTTMAAAATNGLLTARLAVAAMALIRPVPRQARARMSARRMLRRAFSDSLSTGFGGPSGRAPADADPDA